MIAHGSELGAARPGHWGYDSVEAGVGGNDEARVGGVENEISASEENFARGGENGVRDMVGAYSMGRPALYLC